MVTNETDPKKFSSYPNDYIAKEEHQKPGGFDPV